MNRSYSESFPAGLPVNVTYLESTHVVVRGIVLAIEGNTMQMRMLSPLNPGQLIKIETSDTLWLGGVISCYPDNAGYLLKVKLAHALYNLGDLERLARAITGEPADTHEARQEAVPVRSERLLQQH
jgi:hypothetical protein